MKDYSLNFEPGLKRDIYRILSQSVGKANAILGDRLAEMLHWRTRPEGSRGLKNFKCIMRACISELRLEGAFICATGGKQGGYYWAANMTELREFTTSEFHNKAMDMLHKEKVMITKGLDKWGPDQPRLFE